MDEDDTWYGSLIQCGPGHIVLGGSQLPAKGAQQPPPCFRTMSIVATVAHFSCCRAVYSYAVNGHPGVSDCQSVDRQVKNTDVLPVSSRPGPFFSYPLLPIPFLSSPHSTSTSLLEVGPLIAAWESGEGISSPADPGGARPPNAFWCIVGIN